MSEKKRILITGPVFPPAGGVSIHLKRLYEYFTGTFQIDFADESRNKKPGVYNIRSLRPDIYFQKVYKADLIFIHSGIQLFRFIHILFARLLRKPILITFHSYPSSRRGLARIIELYFLQHVDRIIAVNDIVSQRINRPDKTVIRHAFLPPLIQNEPDLPGYISEWIRVKRDEGFIIVCSNASQLVIFNGEDLYGLDLCIELASRWESRNNKLAIIFVVSSLNRNKEYYHHSKEKISSLGIEGRFLLVNEPLSFVRLIQQSDIVCRPTNSDGDSLTVREALAMSKPVVVSDAVERPIGSVLFRSRDISDLERVVGQIAKGSIGDSQREMVSFDGYYEPYETLFNELTAGKK